MEKIISINEGSFKLSENDWGAYEGYTINTSEQQIKVGISSGQSCCESYGYLSTEDNHKEFIGANLLSISIVDQALNNKKVDDLEYLDEGGAMFVNFETDKGLFQLVAYNSHNGYYGHEAVLVSKQLNHTEGL